MTNNYQVMVFSPRQTRMDVVYGMIHGRLKMSCCTVFNIIHLKSFKWLNNDSHVGHVTQGELGRRHNRLMSCLGH